MSVPQASVGELDGQVGVVPSNVGDLECKIGDAQGGPLNVPAVFSNPTAIVATYVGGPLVEAGCYALEQVKGKGYIVLCRTDRTTDGAAGTVDTSGITGSSVPTVNTSGADKPWDAFEVVFQVLLGGTVGTGPITLRYSLDGGRGWSKKVNLGTAVTYTIPLSGIVVDLTAAPLNTGDTWSFETTAPKWSDSDLAVTLAAVQASGQPIEQVTVVGDCSGDEKDTINTAATASHEIGKHRWFSCATRKPTVGEDDTTYQAALIADFADHESVDVEVVAGACRVLTSVPVRSVWHLRQSAGILVSSRYSTLSPEQDAAAIDLGPLPGGTIKDANLNAVEHDEFETPGLDDAGFTTLRSWNGRGGVFVNNPRIQSPEGSDFRYVQHRRVMNRLRIFLQAYLETRLSKPVKVSTKTGYILETEAKDIESGADLALWDAAAPTNKVGSQRMISGEKTDKRFVLSRTDNILATDTLTYDARAVPLGYPKDITGALGFSNPARAV